MKTLKYKLFVLLISVGIASCDTDYIENPDDPEVAPSTNLVNNAQFDLAFELNDQWTAGRGTLGFAQYWAGQFYTEENRYQLRTNQVDALWNEPYKVLTDLKKVIELNEDPETKVLMSAYGDNNNQIQAARIMMAFTFSKLVDTFGHAPYWSYGQRDNPDFQGVQLDEGIDNPKYTEDIVIYTDLLKELKEAADNMNDAEVVFTEGDNFCNGDPTTWIKFANSLRLRLATHIKNVDPQLAQTVYEESKDNTIASNDDNIMLTFGYDDITGGPWHQAFTVGARRDFAPALPFTDLLYNKTGPFMSIGTKDPRIEQYFDPRNDTEEIIGLPYGFGDDPARIIEDEGIPDANIIKPDYTQSIIEYAEIEFIKSEFEGWDQSHYENGVRASMERWEVPNSDIDSYMNSLPQATEETVLTQKYIALYMDGMESWTEYRRSGFPKTLTLPGDTYEYTDGNGEQKTVTFTTLIPGLNEIPSRVTYPNREQLINKDHWDEARNKFENGDAMFSKIFWDVTD